MKLSDMNKKLVLPDGSVFYGYAFGDPAESVCELVFNTSMVGYQEIVSDPSYTAQAVVMTYPLIGNYGVADEDYETKIPTLGGLIVREYNDLPSNFRYTKTLSEVMEEYGIPGLAGVDTRALTKYIRSNGSCKALLTAADKPQEECMRILSETQLPHDQVRRVSCRKRWYARTSNHRFNVVAIDCGIKLNIVRELCRRGCNVTVMPWNTGAAEVRRMHPDGVLFSNGPGDPEDVPEIVGLIKELRGEYPVFGVCLGHQLICLSYGAKTYKLRFGHRGGNHPVKNLLTDRVEITSQNHSFAVDGESIAGTPLTVTHLNLLDGTVEGVSCARDKIFSVQYHPESAPGPQDSGYLFDEFIRLMEREQNGGERRAEA